MYMKWSRQDILMHSMDFAFQLDGWNPPLIRVLEGLDDGLVDWSPTTGSANTIRQIVVHLIFYKEQLLQRLQGVDSPDHVLNEDTFLAYTEHSWEQTVAKLVQVQRAIQVWLQNVQDDDLDRPLPHVPIGGQLLTLTMHDVYHTGQIVLLRKMQGSWPLEP